MYCLIFAEAFQCIGINVVLQLDTIVLLCVMTYNFFFFHEAQNTKYCVIQKVLESCENI